MNTLWLSDIKLIIESIELNIITRTDKGEIEILKELLQRLKKQSNNKWRRVMNPNKLGVFIVRFAIALVGCFLIDDIDIVFGVLALIWCNNFDYKKEPIK